MFRKINPNKRYRFLTRRECLRKWGTPIPPSWNELMTCFLGQEVPQSLVAKLSCEEESSVRQPNFCRGGSISTPWTFCPNEIVLLKDQDSY